MSDKKLTLRQLRERLDEIEMQYGDDIEVLVSVNPGLTEGFFPFNINVIGQDKTPQALVVPKLPSM